MLGAQPEAGCGKIPDYQIDLLRIFKNSSEQRAASSVNVTTVNVFDQPPTTVLNTGISFHPPDDHLAAKEQDLRLVPILNIIMPKQKQFLKESKTKSKHAPKVTSRDSALG